MNKSKYSILNEIEKIVLEAKNDKTPNLKFSFWGGLKRSKGHLTYTPNIQKETKMIELVHEHYVDLSLLPERANILDLGCRGFLFTDYFRNMSHNVCGVDVDNLEREDYFRIAISGHIGRVGIKKNSSDPQSTSICDGDEIMCMTLNLLSSTVGVAVWDLIKMDIEGSEYEVIMSLTSPPAKQLSIEFHLHTGIYGDAQVKEMEDKLLSLGYSPAKHDKTNQHGAGFNYWSSLWILKDNK